MMLPDKSDHVPMSLAWSEHVVTLARHPLPAILGLGSMSDMRSRIGTVLSQWFRPHRQWDKEYDEPQFITTHAPEI